MGNIVKNQHYIPEGLLHFFTNDKSKVVEILVNEGKIYETNPRNSMSETFVYEDEMLETNTLEKFFAEVDGDAKKHVNSMIEEIEKLKKGESSITAVKEKTENYLRTAILFYYRSGALLTEFGAYDNKHKIPSLSKKIVNIPYINSLGDTIKNCYQFAILESEDAFLLSDQYLSTCALKVKSRYFNISNRHIGLKDTLILLPLSSKYYIAYWHSTAPFFLKPDELQSLDDDKLIQINKAIINNSYIKCVGAKKEPIEAVLPSFSRKSPTQTYAGGNPSGYVTGAINKKEVFFDNFEQEAYEMVVYLQYTRYKDVGRNDKCPCGSDIKFKRCHLLIVERYKEICKTFGRPQNMQHEDMIPGVIVIEHPVDSWSGYSTPKSEE